MLKIYNAFDFCGDIVLKDYITFDNGRFSTGHSGFGDVMAWTLGSVGERTNYELSKLEYYQNYLKKVKVCDGFVDDLFLFNPVSYQMLEEKYSNIFKDNDTYEKYGLNEEAILLFTNYVRLEYEDNDLVQRVFGRRPENGMYLLMPNASVDMIAGSFFNENREHYEVLQSQNLGKQLVLTKMNRKI